MKKKCLFCGKEIIGHFNRKYCDDLCKESGYNRQTKLGECCLCGKSFKMNRYQNSKYCSTGCWYSYKRLIGKKKRRRKCYQCGRFFYVRQASLEGKYCSYRCSGRSKSKTKKDYTCKYCGCHFKAHGRKRVYCSRKCYDADPNKIKSLSKVTKICEFCGVGFLARKRRRFCSKLCADTSRRGKQMLSLHKSESIRTYVSKGTELTEIFVKTENKQLSHVQSNGRKIYKNKWKRKAVVVLESLLGRKLVMGEHSRIKFVDGNRLNCSPNNLLLSDCLSIKKCKICGKEVVRYKTNQMGQICIDCIFKNSELNPNAVLTKEVVSCIRFLINVHFEDFCFQIGRRGFKSGCNRLLSEWFEVGRSSIENVISNKTFKGVEPMAKTEVYKTLLKQHDQLKRKGAATIYARVTLLAKVYEDPNYVSAMQKDGKTPIEDMNARVSDTCANITELFQMLKMFPKEKQWVDGDLAAMRMDMLNKLRDEQNQKKSSNGNGKSNGQSKSKKKTATVAQMTSLEDKVKELETEVKNLKRLLKERDRTIRILEKELGTVGV